MNWHHAYLNKLEEIYVPVKDVLKKGKSVEGIASVKKILDDEEELAEKAIEENAEEANISEDLKQARERVKSEDFSPLEEEKDWEAQLKYAPVPSRVIRSRILFRIDNEGIARKEIEKARVKDKELQKNLNIIKELTNGEHLKVKDLGADDKDKLESAIKEVKRISEEINQDEIKLRSTYEKKYKKDGEDPDIVKAEDRAYLDGIERLKEVHPQDDEAIRAFEEERLLAKRPYSLLHFDENRKKVAAKCMNNMSNDNDLVREANKQIRSKFPNAPNFNLTKINAMVNEYINDVLQQPTAYHIRVPNCKTMGLIMKSGRFRTQIEGQKSFS